MARLTDLRAAQDVRLAAEIRRRRGGAGMTWQQLADHCGVALRTAQSWGAGERIPEKQHIAALDELFG